ncbi:MAG: OPT/YSL family transporter [Sphaerochaetaceae bacterium]|nr:OPT/YSL family transporter [Sphaerochaetaceae bacterium]
MKISLPQLTVRAVVVGILGLLVITSSSMYVALRMGALPWPTVFVTIVSLAIIGRFKNSNLNEINLTHTIMSSGAMVAGGLAFTIPGIWMRNPEATVSVSYLLIITISGALLGTLFSIVARKKYVEGEQLPYPMGQAAYRTLISATQNRKEAVVLFSAMAFAILFTVLRDSFGMIPPALMLYAGGALVAPLFIWLSPMAAGIGAIIGPALSLFWLGGAVFAFLILEPLGIRAGLFADMSAAELFRQNLGIGLMVGTGLAIIVKFITQLIRNRGKKKEERSGDAAILFGGRMKWVSIGLMALVVLVLAASGTLPFFAALLLIVGIYVTTQIAALLTGQTGINPMEILGILVLLLVQLVTNVTIVQGFSVAAVTAIACGLAGDLMNDTKSGYLLKTDAKTQIIAEGIGGVIGAVVAVIALLVLKESFGGFGTDALPAPQAKAVSAMVGGLTHVPAFVIGAVIGLILYLLGLPSATLGLGVYLPFSISSIMGAGAILYMIAAGAFGKKRDIKGTTGLLASGFLGGEGITGVVIAIIAMLS